MSATDPITDDLTEPQRRAVCHGDGPLLVVAGAGTGKTRAITRRIACLVRRGVPPSRILGITFTNKAADEMRRRVEAMVGTDVTVSTFHSFCARLLRQEARHLGLEPSFSIYDRTDSARVVRQVVNEMSLDKETNSPARLLDEISVHKDRLETPERAAEEALDLEGKTAAEVYRRYNERLQRANAMDFDDLLTRTVELFSAHPECLQRLQDRFLHVLVDEYQDTNLPQHLIARALQGKHRNITAVGDPDQMIYTWRGARLENILEFEQDFPGATVIMLEQNYRSTGNILHAASCCVRHNRLRHDKALWTAAGAGEQVEVREFEDPRLEAEWIAAAAAEMSAAGVAPGQIAVLYRTKYLSAQLEAAFAERRVPFQVVDSVALAESKVAKDIRAYLQLLVNSRDDEAFRRIVNVPPRGIGQATVAQLAAAAARLGRPLTAMARLAGEVEGLTARARTALARFCALCDRLLALPTAPVEEFIRHVIDAANYLDCVPAEDRDDARERIEQLLTIASQFDGDQPGAGLTGFLELAALRSDQDGWDPRAPAVPLMTLHSAKGLEFDVVFLCGVEQGILPHQRSLADDARSDEDYAMEEERRLLHVGMTRARKRLCLTYARRRRIRGMDLQTGPSPFLDELPAEGVLRAAAQRRSASDPLSRVSPEAGSPDGDLVRRTANRTANAKRPEGPPPAGVEVGDSFTHKTFGEGTVVGVETAGKRRLLRVQFPQHGVLTLLV